MQAQMSEHMEQLERTRGALDAANERMAEMEADMQITLDEVCGLLSYFYYFTHRIDSGSCIFHIILFCLVHISE